MAGVDYGTDRLSSASQDRKKTRSLEELSVHGLAGRSSGSSNDTATTFESSVINKVPHSSRYVYMNQAYNTSVTTLSTTQPSIAQASSNAGVVREQYWACSRWPRAQRVLAVVVGVLAGAVIGLAISMGLKSATQDNPLIGPIFRNPVSD